MRKALACIILVVAGLSVALPAKSQNMGVSFSFFFPKNGYFSAPVSPFSLRGVGFNLTRNIAIETGASLYRMTGMNISGLPFESAKPMVGPFFNIMVPLELILQFGTQDFEFRIKGGGFAFYNLGSKLNEGNIDRALADYMQVPLVRSNLNFDNKIGYGYEFGAEYIQYINRKLGVSLGANYFIGGADMNLRGQVTVADGAGSVYNIIENYDNSKLDYTGLEISIGVSFYTN